MTYLSRQVEQVVLSLHQIVHAVLVTNIGNIKLNGLLVSGQVEQVPPIIRDQGIYNGHLSPPVRQTACQVRSNKTGPTGNKDAPSLVSFHQFIITDHL